MIDALVEVVEAFFAAVCQAAYLYLGECRCCGRSVFVGEAWRPVWDVGGAAHVACRPPN